MKYIYVQAIVQNTIVGPGSIRFRHVILGATDQDEAYTLGGRWSDRQPGSYRPDRIARAKADQKLAPQAEGETR
jgi:hypothetical protein